MKFPICKSATCVRKAFMILCQLVLAQSTVLSQDLTVDAAGIHIPSGVYLVIEDMDATSNATVVNNGTLEVTGDWTNTTGTNISGTGTYQFTTGSGQQIDAQNKSLYTVELDNSNGATLLSGLSVNSELILTDGKLKLDDYNLTIEDGAAISGESSTSYISTGSSKTGVLTRYLDTSQLEFPIGFDGASYVPVYIKCATCDGSQTFSARVHDKAYTDPSDTTSTQLTTSVVTNTWVISSTAQKDIDLTVQWNPSDESLSQSTVSMGKWEDGTSTAWDKGTVGARPTGTPRTFTRKGINAVNGTLCFGIGESGSPLPVELIQFDVAWKEVNQVAELTWATATEIDNSHFEVERSYDGVSFEIVGAVAGNGTSISGHKYGFDDVTVDCSGIVYYRLRQVDYNGDWEYSQIRTLSCGRNDLALKMEAFPNPNSGIFSVDAPEAGTVTLFTLDGKIVERFNIAQGINQLTTERNGLFTLHFSSPRRNSNMQLIIH